MPMPSSALLVSTAVVAAAAFVSSSSSSSVNVRPSACVTFGSASALNSHGEGRGGDQFHQNNHHDRHRRQGGDASKLCLNSPPHRHRPNRYINKGKAAGGSSSVSSFHNLPRHLFHPLPHSGASLSSPLSSLSSTSASPYSTADCKEYYTTQPLDHFAFSSSASSSSSSKVGGEQQQRGDAVSATPATFQQRYYVCKKDEWWAGPGEGPIFFYTGNEANVELYVNMTGLMWENAQAMGAALVFAEHRYFGKSLPFPNEPMPKDGKLKFLSTDQAMHDYVTLIQKLRTEWGTRDSAFIGFGGSYGGMLCAWTRAQFPNALDGCVAGSAPVIDFVGMEPPLDFGGFAQVETVDASVDGGGGSDDCKTNIHTVLANMYEALWNKDGAQIATEIGVCDPNAAPNSPASQVNGQLMLNSFVNAIGMMTMGSYPYPSSYMMMGGKGELPPYPMRVACQFLDKAFPPASSSSASKPSAALHKAFGEAMKVFYAANGPIPCINVTTSVNEASEIVNYLWGWLACTSVMMPSSMNGDIANSGKGKGGDMFYPAPFSVQEYVEGCEASYQITPNQEWVQTNFGGRRLAETATNIVFTNGELDPWKFGGFNEDDPNAKFFNIKNKVIAVRNAGHHMELMFANPKDNQTNVVEVRQTIVEEIKRWIQERRRQP